MTGCLMSKYIDWYALPFIVSVLCAAQSLEEKEEEEEKVLEVWKKQKKIIIHGNIFRLQINWM